jgi:uncharacterized protein
MVREQVLRFPCEGEPLLGVLSGAASPASRGVLIVVGGPQYRAGSHRQFTLLARELAAAGVPVLRFDYRGMGDSGGDKRTFERVDADIHCALDHFFASAPGLKDVVIWGLCDAASAALFYAHQDPRVSGLVLVNPWVHTTQGAARAYLRHYYVQRLFQASLWQKIASGEFSVRRAAAAFRDSIVDSLRSGGSAGGEGRRRDTQPVKADETPFPQRMEEGLRRFRGRVLLLLSGKDFTAQEFKDLVSGSRGWRRLLADTRVTRHDLPEANHTFSRRDWRAQVARWTVDWLKSY